MRHTPEEIPGLAFRRIWPFLSPMNSGRRVVLVTTQYPPLVGGAATYFSLLSNALAKQGARVTVLTTRSPGLPQVALEGQVVVWRRIPDLATKPDLIRKWIQAPATVVWLTLIWLRDKMDIVHSHGSKSVTLGCAVFSSLLRVPVIYDIQDFFSRPRVISRGKTPRYISTGGRIADRLHGLGIDRRRILVIPSIPPDGARAPITRSAPQTAACRCLFVGELNHPVKGTDILLDAFALLRGADPTTLLDIIGDGPARQQDEAFVHQHGLDAFVTFKGAQPAQDVLRQIDRADIVILASRTEGVPRVVLEAFARGVPVIAPQVGGIPEAVRDGENGLLVPTEDPTALAEAIARLARDPQLRRALGERGRSWIDQLPTWEKLASSIMDFYGWPVAQELGVGASYLS